MIKKVKGGYQVKSESGKNLSKPVSLDTAKKRLAQVEMFKHMKATLKKGK